MTTSQSPQTYPENRIVVIRQQVGWEVREEQGPLLLRSAIVTDWHRVERTMHAFKLLPFTPLGSRL